MCGMAEDPVTAISNRGVMDRHHSLPNENNTDGQTQTDKHRQTDADKQTNRQTDKETDTRDREANKQRETETDIDRQRETETKRDTPPTRSAPDSDVDVPQASPPHVHASDSEPESCDADGQQGAPVARGRWPLVPWHPRPVERASGKRLSLPSTTAVFWPVARRWLQVFGGPLWTSCYRPKFGSAFWRYGVVSQSIST